MAGEKPFCFLRVPLWSCRYNNCLGGGPAGGLQVKSSQIKSKQVIINQLAFITDSSLMWAPVVSAAALVLPLSNVPPAVVTKTTGRAALSMSLAHTLVCEQCEEDTTAVVVLVEDEIKKCLVASASVTDCSCTCHRTCRSASMTACRCCLA